MGRSPFINCGPNDRKCLIQGESQWSVLCSGSFEGSFDGVYCSWPAMAQTLTGGCGKGRIGGAEHRTPAIAANSMGWR